jgi:hypothetical protein
VVVSMGSTLNRRGCVGDAILNIPGRATQRFLAYDSSYVHAKSHTDVTASVDGVFDRQRALDLAFGLVQANQLVCRRTRGTFGINRNEEQHSHVPSLSIDSCVLSSNATSNPLAASAIAIGCNSETSVLFEVYRTIRRVHGRRVPVLR